MNKVNHSKQKEVVLLAIETSCDDTSVAVLRNGKILANIVSGQAIHGAYGGVVPELASRDHQKNIIPVIEKALSLSKINLNELSAVAFTKGPGLMGSLLVGLSMAKSFSLALKIPLIEVNHMQAHVIANFISREGEEKEIPQFPFICLTVSGGHTQLLLVKGIDEFVLLGETEDDAVGEAFDKAAKILGLGYPGGPLIDKWSLEGNPQKFNFPKSQVKGYNFSFSGIKTAFLYFIQRESEKNPKFIEENLPHICASYQHHLINVLMDKLLSASQNLNIYQLAVAGGVSANSLLRQRMLDLQENKGFKVFIPDFEFCTDNAAMIAMAGYFKYLRSDFASLAEKPSPRYGVS